MDGRTSSDVNSVPNKPEEAAVRAGSNTAGPRSSFSRTAKPRLLPAQQHREDDDDNDDDDDDNHNKEVVAADKLGIVSCEY
jgi:hypothetical protein